MSDEDVLDSIKNFKKYLEETYLKPNTIITGKRFDFTILVYVLKTYLNNCSEWSGDYRSLFMINVYGSLQRLVSACDAQTICNVADKNQPIKLKTGNDYFAEDNDLGSKYFIGVNGECVEYDHRASKCEEWRIEQLFNSLYAHLKDKRQKLSEHAGQNEPERELETRHNNCVIA